MLRVQTQADASTTAGESSRPGTARSESNGRLESPAAARPASAIAVGTVVRARRRDGFNIPDVYQRFISTPTEPPVNSGVAATTPGFLSSATAITPGTPKPLAAEVAPSTLASSRRCTGKTTLSKHDAAMEEALADKGTAKDQAEDEEEGEEEKEE